MSNFLRVKNWEEFQHYKDRRPPWIKLHIALTDDYSFSSLPDNDKYHLIGIWLLAARIDNKIPNDPGWVGAKIEATSPVNLRVLLDAGFLAPWKRAAGGKAKWSTRYVSAELRVAILERDNRMCCDCKRTQNLEIDHIFPVSQGGTSTADNLQVLCRSCNRAKRARLSAEHVATQNKNGSVAQRQRQRQRQRRVETENKEPKAFVVPSISGDLPSAAKAFGFDVSETIERSLGGAA